MAGGKLAAEIACMACLDDRVLTHARRVYEGDETDHYLCDMGHEFGLDWPDPATEPQWPAPREILEGLELPAEPVLMKRSLRPLKFHKTKDVDFPWEAFVDGIKWTVRLNEFPVEPSLYSLMIDGQVVEELMDWPRSWTKLVRGPDTPSPRQRSLRPVNFGETSDARYPFAAIVDGAEWTVRINEFPEEPTLYSLIVNGEVVEDLVEWPAAWVKPLAPSS